MSPIAKLATYIVFAAGYGALAWGIGNWESADPGLFLGYLAVATAAGCLRIRIPTFSGSLSLHFFFVLICITRLSLPETMLIACAGALFQCLLYLKPPIRWSAVGQDVAVAAAATTLAYAAYHSLGGPPGRSPLQLVLAATVFFLANSIPAAAVTALTERRRFGQLWREYYFWTFPHYVAGGGAAGLLGLLNEKTGWETALLILPLTYWMYHSYRFYLQRLDEERRQARELGALHFRTLEALALAIEGHDPTKHGHLRRVSVYVTAVGRQMGLSETELQALHAAAMLHDIGKLAVPEHILTKPGRLTDAEFECVKIHPVAGAEILEQVRFPYPVAPIVRAHHEKWDGSGYPAGLKGEAIPVGARILAAVDCLDALVSDRYHRRALPLEKAIHYLRTESGRSFDPRVVDILVDRYRDLEAQVEAAERSDRPYFPAAAAAATRLEQDAAAPAEGGAFLARIAAARREEQMLFQLARELGNSLSLDETLAVCALRVKALCPYDSIAIYIRRDNLLVAEYASGESFWSFGLRETPWGQGLVGWVAENRTPVLNADPGAGLRPGSEPGLASALAAPLEGVAGVVGVIALYARGKDAFTLDHLRILSAVSAQAALSVENALKYSQAERSAATDVLTGLPNARSLFLHLDAELARARRLRAPVVVLVCDLDGFKQVNDRYGHLEGNRILRAVAQALKRQCREYDFVARMGGDEFVMVLPGNRMGSLPERIEQFRAAVEAAALDTLPEARIGLSVGEASHPADGEDAESLLAAADRRMYEMKHGRKSRPSAADQLRRLSVGLGATVQ
jgi:diguanylate cyclase (GGDEF)-like protein/putative nucleotidyltransferase with HDIG domain